jgi:putative ABC transport system permease protein
VTPITLSPLDIALSAVLVLADAGLSLALGLRLHRQLGIASLRMVVQLLLVGLVLRFVFALANPAVTLLVIVVMVLAAAREVASRPEARLARGGNLIVGGIAVGAATALTAILALTTAIRPDPWFDPRYAVPLAGIILGNALNAASLTLDAMLGGVGRERVAIEARLCLGETFAAAVKPLVRTAIRRGLLPTINTMSAAGIVTLPGIMTGQILAGMDPMDAVKYQILLMFLLAGGSGIASVLVALLVRSRLTDARQRLRLDRLRAM